MTDNGQNDWAILNDPNCLGIKYGWYPLASISTINLVEDEVQVFIVGYAADRPIGELNVSVGRVTGVREGSGNVLYSASEAPGDSGGPILFEKDGLFSIVGLNVGGKFRDGNTY